MLPSTIVTKQNALAAYVSVINDKFHSQTNSIFNFHNYLVDGNIASVLSNFLSDSE